MDDAASPLLTQMRDIGVRARLAAQKLRDAPGQARTAALKDMAQRLRAGAAEILAANARDVSQARENGQTEAFIDRLTLNPDRIEAMAKGVEVIAALPDPLGAVMSEWVRPTGFAFSACVRPRERDCRSLTWVSGAPRNSPISRLAAACTEPAASRADPAIQTSPRRSSVRRHDQRKSSRRAVRQVIRAPSKLD